MLSPVILEITDNFPSNFRKDIDSLLSSFSYGPVWQTIEWQIMLQQTGYIIKNYFVGIYEDKKLLSYVLIEKRNIGFGFTGFFSLGGPVIGSDKSLQLLSEILKELSVKEKVVFLQIEPFSSAIFPGFEKNYFKNFIEKRTAIIDLKQDDKNIFAHMKPKGRYNIHVAEKAGVMVEQIPYSEESLDIFYRILGETLERDRFAANSKKYFQVFLQYLEKQKLGGLFFAKRQDEVIAVGIFVFFKKTALYYYGASSSDNAKRKYMASYLLQWKAIEEAKNRGCEIFDFFGIAAPNDPHSPLVGVTDFKLKLTDNIKEWPEAQILVIRKFIYLLFQAKRLLKTTKRYFINRNFH